MSETESTDLDKSRTDDGMLRRVVVWGAIFAMVGAAILFASFIAVDWTQGYWLRLIEGHFAAIVGLPMAAVAAFIVVALFRQSEGPIKIEGPGFKIEGATGPVLLWVMCFWVIAWAIKEVWSIGGVPIQ